MVSESTVRHALPLLSPGQAQKELSHNEALTMLDLLAHPFAEGVGTNAPPALPAEGQCWIVGAAPTGAWVGKAQALAGWTAGGWRFVAPREGMVVRTGTASAFMHFTGGAWVAGAVVGATLRLAGQQVAGPRGAAIADAAGGATIDAEARGAIAAILAALRTHGLIAS